MAAESDGVPEAAELLGNYPNPMSGSGTILFRTSEAGSVELQIFDARGGLVRETSKSGSTGIGEIQFERDGLPAGVYFYRVSGGGLEDTGKLVVID